MVETTPLTTAVKSDLPHGWAIGDAIDLARRLAAGRKQRIGYDEAYVAAYDGIVGTLYNTDEPPTFSYLFEAGMRAISARADTTFRDRGIATRSNQTRNGAHWWTYWLDHMVEPDHSGRVTNDLALWQVFEGLEPEERRVLTALSHHLSVTEAAEALGYSKGTFVNRLKQAREHFYELWFEGQTPPPIKRRVVVTINERAHLVTRGWVQERQTKKGVRYYARLWHDKKASHHGIFDTYEEAEAAAKRAEANAILDGFEQDRQEQPAAFPSVRAPVG